ncbi:MAG: polyprenyl synthetase family protein [Chloroflexota bacterium]|nr:polyprenyl synthetase family protein [Chloroflexota bacterium]
MDSRLVGEINSLLVAALEEAQGDTALVGDIGRLLTAEAEVRGSSSSTLELPMLTCEAAGGDAQQAMRAAAAVHGLGVAIEILDDVQDGDAARAIQNSTGLARITNVSSALLASSSLCLSKLPESMYRDIDQLLHRTVLRILGGQHRELAAGEGHTIEECLETIGGKVGSFYAFAARSGGRCVTSNEAMLAALEEFGYNAGVMMQIVDDLLGFRQQGSDGDLANGRRKIPVVYALSVASPPERTRLEGLLKPATEDQAAERDARQLMVSLGAEVYLFAEMSRYRARALDALEQLPDALARIEPLRGWLASRQPPHRGW